MPEIVLEREGNESRDFWLLVRHEKGTEEEGDENKHEENDDDSKRSRNTFRHHDDAERTKEHREKENEVARVAKTIMNENNHWANKTTTNQNDTIVNLPPILNRKPELRVITSVDDNEWDWLKEYDQSDLVSDQIAWLYRPGSHVHFVWKGKASHVDWTDDRIQHKINTEMKNQRRLCRGECNDDDNQPLQVTIVNEFEETEAFWDVYEAGY
jgi:hypothetical protein